METIRIVLCRPFVKLAAGLVFELGAAIGSAGWEEDDRNLEKVGYLNKQTYHLPDGGNGIAYDLSVSDTAICPPEVFESVDLRMGPCRLTRAAFDIEGVQNEVWDAAYKLFDINGVTAQGFEYPKSRFKEAPVSTWLVDRLRNEKIQEVPNEASLDCRNLMPGFYALHFTFPDGGNFQIRFMKSFPLLVFFSNHGNAFQVQKTLY